jgi:hypothetical protein
MLMTNSNDTIGYQTRDFPDFSAVRQSTALPRAPRGNVSLYLNVYFKGINDSQ